MVLETVQSLKNHIIFKIYGQFHCGIAHFQKEKDKSEVEEKKEWKIKRYCLIILIKFIQPKWELIELKET